VEDAGQRLSGSHRFALPARDAQSRHSGLAPNLTRRAGEVRMKDRHIDIARELMQIVSPRAA
jgi:hypothetical protein